MDFFFDAGVESLFLSPASAEDRVFYESIPVSFLKPGLKSWEAVFAAAAVMEGTHLLVFDAGFQKMESPFLIRLMQMSCLGMGVLPFVDSKAESLAACYPVGIRTFADPGDLSSIPKDRDFVDRALAKGLVAPYNVPRCDEAFFERSTADSGNGLATGLHHFSNR